MFLSVVIIIKMTALTGNLGVDNRLLRLGLEHLKPRIKRFCLMMVTKGTAEDGIDIQFLTEPQSTQSIESPLKALDTDNFPGPVETEFAELTGLGIPIRSVFYHLRFVNLSEGFFYSPSRHISTSLLNSLAVANRR